MYSVKYLNVDQLYLIIIREVCNWIDLICGAISNVDSKIQE